MKKHLHKITNQHNRGSLSLLILIGIVIVGSIMLTGGIFPQSEIIWPGDKTVAIPKKDQSSGSEKSLQLRTLEFDSCKEGGALTMQLDTTGSMGGAKILSLKTAVSKFLENMTDDSIIGIQSFNSMQPQNVVVPVSYYKDVKEKLTLKIFMLPAIGNTPTTTALRFSQEVLKDAQTKFPGKKFSFIFVSDGIPEPPSQDPRNPQNAPNPATEIKNMGVTIYTIAIGYGGDFTGLMKDIASSPDKAYVAPNPKELDSIYQQISQRLCGES